MSEGHAVVDAMVALMILSLSLILSFRAVLQAERTTALAREMRSAHVLLDDLMARAPRTFGPADGRTGSFAWRVETRATGAERPIEVCRRFAEVRNVDTGRRYWSATLETCPQGNAS